MVLHWLLMDYKLYEEINPFLPRFLLVIVIYFIATEMLTGPVLIRVSIAVKRHQGNSYKE